SWAELAKPGPDPFQGIPPAEELRAPLPAAEEPTSPGFEPLAPPGAEKGVPADLLIPLRALQEEEPGSGPETEEQAHGRLDVAQLQPADGDEVVLRGQVAKGGQVRPDRGQNTH